MILTCDTSGTNCSAALSEDGQILAEININWGKQHSQLLMPLIEEIFSRTGRDISEVSAFAVNIGPGSFTGLRIGMAVFKAMAKATGKPLYGFDTFTVQAEHLRYREGYILVINDALRKTFYSSLLKSDGENITKISEDSVRTIEELKELTKGLVDKSVIVTGDGLLKYRKEIEEALPGFKTVKDKDVHIRASFIAELAEEELKNGVKPGEVLPYYMRKPQAEREYEEKHGIIND